MHSIENPRARFTVQYKPMCKPLSQLIPGFPIESCVNLHFCLSYRIEKFETSWRHQQQSTKPSSARPATSQRSNIFAPDSLTPQQPDDVCVRVCCSMAYCCPSGEDRRRPVCHPSGGESTREGFSILSSNLSPIMLGRLCGNFGSVFKSAKRRAHDFYGKQQWEAVLAGWTHVVVVMLSCSKWAVKSRLWFFFIITKILSLKFQGTPFF